MSRMMVNTVVLLAVLLAACAVPAAAAGEKDNGDDAADAAKYESSVVGLDVTYQLWDEDRPWAKRIPKHRKATAVLVEGSYLLTTAQMVDQATFIRLATFGRTRPVEPRVVRVAPDINLALLEIEDAATLETLTPAPVAAGTPTAGVLRTVRWSGQQLEASASRVIGFRVERSWGGRLDHAFLHMRTDMGSGGWGEPVFSDGELVGLTVSQKQQRSRAIPAEVLNAFLEQALAEGPMPGFPCMGISWQVNEDRALAAYLGQQGEPRGVLIREVPWGSSACGVLEPRDLLLELGGHAIDAEGYYRHRQLGRLKLSHLVVEGYRPGDAVAARVLRGGEEIDVSITLRPYPAALDLVPARRDGPPPFVVAGGLVIRELDFPYLGTWGNDWDEAAPISLTTRYRMNRNGQSPERRRYVLVTQVLPVEYNVGYQAIRDAVIEEVNGRPIASIVDVVSALGEPRDGFHLIRLSPDSGREMVVLDAAGLDQATAEVMETYRVPEAVRLPPEPLPAGGGDCPGSDS